MNRARARLLIPALVLVATMLAAPLSPAAAAPVDSGRREVVKPGDTLSHIARRLGVQIRDLATLNGLANPNRVRAGATLKVPGAAAAPVAAPAPALVQATYVVRPGDSLSLIAARAGIPAAELAAANGLTNPNLIRLGATLKLPLRVPATLPSRLLGSPERLALWGTFDRWALEYGVPADLLKAMTWYESGWQNGVVSSVGARGIGQLMPATVDFASSLIGQRLDPADPGSNIRMSARYLRWLLDETGGDVPMALGGYYQGLRSMRERGPYLDTRSYVDGILTLRSRFAG